MALFTLGLMNTGCEEHFDHPQVSGDKKVDVSLSIGFADEVDGYTFSASSSTKSATKQGVFDYDLQPSLQTKSTGVKPDKLYNLEIQQYDRSGNRIGGMSSAATQEIGSALTVTLAEATDCQLVLVAWGEGNTTTLGTKSLADAQKVSLDASVIKNLDPVSGMNKMPYVLHLKHVNVTKNGTNGIISSPEDKDVRLLLQRLATRLTLEWKYSYTGYTLKQILLESIPLNYNVVAMSDENNTYPSLFDRFTTIQLSEAEITAGRYSCWIPANVRGSSSSATSQIYRIKSNAPTGSAYASLIAVNDDDSKKKLNYRVYLGGNNSSDFNLYSNTDYNYVVDIKHTGLPVDDRRVTIIDPIPASESNNNLVPTANCFMVAPGGAFCFNPYKYYINGNPSENTLLQVWCASSKIQSVKVLWQTKENGDVGDPVLGVANSSTDHTNIVDLTDGGDLDKARIYCRVAPNTTGGSGLIAAYDGKDGTGNILWSWHIWVTDYSPASKGNTTVLEPANKRKLKFEKSGVEDQLPMMDRNLGAVAGFVTLPTDPVDMSKASGFHYQGGRKDPFPSSYSSSVIYSVDFNKNDRTPPNGMLNQYGPDGITYFPHQGTSQTNASYADLYKSPHQLFGGLASDVNWNTTDKSLHDPCPAGWRIPAAKNYRALFEGDDYLSTNGVNARYQARGISGDMNTFLDKGDGNGYLLRYDNNDTHFSYFRMSGYPPFYYQFRYVGTTGNLWTREVKKGFTFGNSVVDGRFHSFCIGVSWGMTDAHTTRCIQEQ